MGEDERGDHHNEGTDPCASVVPRPPSGKEGPWQDAKRKRLGHLCAVVEVGEERVWREDERGRRDDGADAVTHDVACEGVGAGCGEGDGDDAGPLEGRDDRQAESAQGGREGVHPRCVVVE